MTTRAPRIHTADYIAWYKHITGEWQYNFAAGEIHNTRTGKPVKFHKNSNGYLTTAVRIHNTTTHILKHRAIWIAAHGILALPLDYTLEIHHKNHNPADCRIHNLQLVTLPQNRKNPQRTHGPIPPETVRELRSRRPGTLLARSDAEQQSDNDPDAGIKNTSDSPPSRKTETVRNPDTGTPRRDTTDETIILFPT